MQNTYIIPPLHQTIDHSPKIAFLWLARKEEESNIIQYYQAHIVFSSRTKKISYWRNFNY